MTKPAITKRSVKGAALTYSELDTNFENLKDATITLTAGTGGTAVTADLNGNITLVAGTGVTLTGDNTAKTITVTASGGSGSGTVNTGVSSRLAFYPSSGTVVDDCDLLFHSAGDVRGIKATGTSDTALVSSGLGSITVAHGGTINLNSATNPIQLSASTVTLGANDTGTVNLQVNQTPEQKTLAIRSKWIGNTNASIVLSGTIYLSSAGIPYPTSFFGGPVELPKISTTDRDLNDAYYPNGSMIYNSTTNKFQGRAGGTWVDLH
jgi:hypothetical protein